jgi:hypothetical protein
MLPLRAHTPVPAFTETIISSRLIIAVISRFGNHSRADFVITLAARALPPDNTHRPRVGYFVGDSAPAPAAAQAARGRALGIAWLDKGHT